LLAPFLLHNGIPAYIHDWSWPPDQAGLRAMTARAASAWVPDGLGAPNIFPSALPQFYLEWLLAWPLPSKAVLDLLLILTFAIGIAGGAFVGGGGDRGHCRRAGLRLPCAAALERPAGACGRQPLADA